MPDLWVDVDTAIIVPVNIMPLLDDTDFKTIETAIVYDSAGIALTWNFVTCAGVVTAVAVTPTTGGVYDWSEPVADKGMYAIEIPASGGASANNDTEGVGWFTGVATGVLPWRGPTIGFRRAALNDLLIDGGTASTNLEDFFDGTGYAGGTAKLTVDLVKIMGQTITGTAAQIVAAFTKFFDKASPTGTINSLPDAVPGANGGLPTTNGTKLNQTADLTVGQSIAVSDKTGFSLAATGLDTITATRPSAKATTFPQMLVQLFYHFFGKVTLTATEMKNYAADGTTVVTTQMVSDNGITQTQGEAT